MARTALIFCVGIVAVVMAGAGLVRADEPPSIKRSVLEFPGWLPGSVAYASDGKIMVVGGSGGEVVAIDRASRRPIWKANVAGGFAGVAFSSDEKSLVATVPDGVRVLDRATGHIADSLEEKASHPVAVGVFPDVEIRDGERTFTQHKIVFANARGCFVKTWIPPAAAGTISLNTVGQGQPPDDPDAVPLALDPFGRSVILTGPIHRETGKHVLWAWVAGNYEPGSPGNRLMEGHDGTVVSAAWSRDGKTAVTGDARGRVIIWDVVNMKEKHRREFGHRVAALAVSPRSESIAATVVGNLAEFHIWETAQPQAPSTLIHAETADFNGPIQACLTFSPDGRQLAGSVCNQAWLKRLGDLVGKLQLWEVDKPRAD